MNSDFLENQYSFSHHGKAVNTHWIDCMEFKPEELRNNSTETYKRAKAGHQEGLGMSHPDSPSAIQKDTVSHYCAEITALTEQEIAKALNKQGLKCRIIKK